MHEGATREPRAADPIPSPMCCDCRGFTVQTACLYILPTIWISLFYRHALKHGICSARNDADIAFVLTGRCISCRVYTSFHNHQILVPGRARVGIPFSLTTRG